MYTYPFILALGWVSLGVVLTPTMVVRRQMAALNCSAAVAFRQKYWTEPKLMVWGAYSDRPNLVMLLFGLVAMLIATVMVHVVIWPVVVFRRG